MEETGLSFWRICFCIQIERHKNVLASTTRHDFFSASYLALPSCAFNMPNYVRHRKSLHLSDNYTL